MDDFLADLDSDLIFPKTLHTEPLLLYRSCKSLHAPTCWDNPKVSTVLGMNQ